MDRPESPLHKRPRTSTSTYTPASTSTSTSPSFVEEEETTDLKLALLTSLHPTTDPSTLLELLLTSHGSVAAASALLQPTTQRPTTATTTQQSSLAPFLTTPAPIPRPPKKGHTLHLYTPSHFAALTPTTLHPSFLPAPLATTLLTELLHESHTFAAPSSFVLFGRAVVSPHTACLFLRATAPPGDYSYQGTVVAEPRLFTPSMAAATALVEARVNAEMARRARRHGQLRPGAWRVNAAVVNCYRGGAQSVGWHADQPTYLGPAAVIASVSLGCVREFRVRRVGGGSGKDGEEEEEREGEGEGEGAYGLWLPHNSLLVMHAGMQEGWKHSVHPARSVDQHPLAGSTRINITYRCYRESLQPSLTPRCTCGEAAMLRSVLGSTVPRKGYFWMCAQEYKVGGASCGYFVWAQFDEFGEPPWSRLFVAGTDVGGDECGVPCGGGGGEVGVEETGEQREEDEQQQEPEECEWSDETVEGSERDLAEDWEDAEIAQELQEWRDGLLQMSE